MKSLNLCALFVLVLASLTGCDPETNASKSTPDVGFETRFPIGIENSQMQVQLAIHPQEQRKGLMYRNSMPTNEGMIFIYEEPTQMSFWMANTLIPLDIGFFDATGTLKEVRKMYPNVTTPVKSVSAEILFALEMNQGWFAENNVKPGAKINMNDLRKAIAKRGVSSDKFGQAEVK